MSTHIPDDDPQDPLAARLRDALSSEASMVQPSDDGLQNIRSGIDARARRPWWKHPAAPALAAAAVLGLMAGGIAVALNGDGDDDGNVVAGQPTTSAPESSPSQPSDTATPGPTAATMPIEGDVYVYYVMDDGQGPRLYREERPNIGMDPVQMALTTMFSEPATDPDYISPWSGAELGGYRVAGDTATVRISSSPVAAGEVTPIGLQQIVYTVTANDKSVSKVRVFVGDRLVSTDDQLTRAPMLDVQGMIWLLGPAEGATVSSPVTISGYGTAFEGTISWEVRQGGTKVAENFTQGGANGEFGEFTDTVDLDPGTYELRAFESSAEDGRPLHVDTKTFTVQ